LELCLQAPRPNRGDRLTWAFERPKNTLGAAQTIFKIRPEVARELQAQALPLDAASPERPAPTQKEVEHDQEEQIDRLSPTQMPDLVVGLLRAMGYRTSVAEAGPDRGVDVFASPDGLGLQDPGIFVEVKHRTAQTGAPQLRSFLGGRRKGDRCLYVSTRGFTRLLHSRSLSPCREVAEIYGHTGQGEPEACAARPAQSQSRQPWPHPRRIGAGSRRTDRTSTLR
jgi:restriction endonuclease Mrr